MTKPVKFIKTFLLIPYLMNKAKKNIQEEISVTWKEEVAINRVLYLLK